MCPKDHTHWHNKVCRVNLSLAITNCHHSASLAMEMGDLWDRFFYPNLTLMMDSNSKDPKA